MCDCIKAQWAPSSVAVPTEVKLAFRRGGTLRKLRCDASQDGSNQRREISAAFLRFFGFHSDLKAIVDEVIGIALFKAYHYRS